MTRSLVPLSLLFLAIALYFVGIASGALTLFALGTATELMFWVRASSRSGRRNRICGQPLTA